MSGGVCAVMLVKDEADIIETTIRHLLWHVDEILVADNMSSDGTSAILARLTDETSGRVIITTDTEVGYYQDRKTTALAMEALARGHRWVIPVDSDEIWQHNDTEVAIRDHLAGVSPDVGIFTVPVFNHICTDEDDSYQDNPVWRIKWRQRKPGMQKIITRLRPDLYIEMGNHSARTNGKVLTVPGPFNVRHFSWRSEEQFLRKIVNGRAAYAATNLSPMYGVGWRVYDGASDDAIREAYREHFVIKGPHTDQTMIMDRAPLRGGTA